MANPWEEYQKPAEAAPWEEFSPPPMAGVESGSSTVDAKKAAAAKKYRGEFGEANHPLAKALVGAKHGWDKAALGLKGIFTDLSPEEQAQLSGGAAAKEEAGGWGTAGELGAEMLATAPIGAGAGSLAARGAAKVLPKAVTAAARGSGIGTGVVGRVLNPANAGRAAVEGAAAGGVLAPGEDESRLGNMALGGVVGGVAPAALATVAAPVKWAAQELGTSAKRGAVRAARALERTLGKDVYDDAVRAVRNAEPSSLPLSTAAAADNPALARIERGVRNRQAGGFEWGDHDAKVYEKAWGQLQDALSQGENAPILKQQADELFKGFQAKTNSMGFAQADRTKIGESLAKLKTDNEVIANPALMKEIDNAINAVSNPEASLGVLPQLYTTLGDAAQGSTAIGKARDAIKGVVDSRTKGGFSTMLDNYGKVKDQLKGAQAALDIQGSFMTPQGVVPGKAHQLPGPGAGRQVPEIQAQALRGQLAQKGEQQGVDVLGGQARQDVGDLMTELQRQDLYRASQTPGSTAVDTGNIESVLASGRNNPIYMMPGLRGIASQVANVQEQQIGKILDNAMRDPQAFLRMVDQKAALGRPLSAAEKRVQQMLMMQARGLGAAQVGDQNAP